MVRTLLAKEADARMAEVVAAIGTVEADVIVAEDSAKAVVEALAHRVESKRSDIIRISERRTW